MEKLKKRYETPDVEELEGNLFLVEAETSPKEQGMDSDVDEEEL